VYYGGPAGLHAIGVRMRAARLAALVVAVMPSLATAHDSPTSVTPPEIERYKFGVESDCRDAGARKADPPVQVNSFCSCLLDTLNRNLSTFDWQKATFFSQQNLPEKEAGVIAPLRDKIEQCHTAALAAAPAPPSPEKPVPSLVGAWQWKRPASDCRVLYTLRSDGTGLILRGEEKTEVTYVLSGPSQSGRYKLALTTTKYHGGRDCAGSSTDTTGKTIDAYLVVAPDGNTMAMCDSDFGLSCRGPFEKKESN
jgi:hypothetical protein